MPQTSLTSNSTLKNFTIPVAALFREYAWVKPPATWDGVKIFGAYLGHEIWGRGRLWVEFDNYRFYSFAADSALIFSDGFESGNAGAWQATQP